VFVDFNGRFLHKRMGVVASTPEKEILAASNPGLPVFVVEGQTQQSGRFLSLGGSSHGGSLWKPVAELLLFAVE